MLASAGAPTAGEAPPQGDGSASVPGAPQPIVRAVRIVETGSTTLEGEEWLPSATAEPPAGILLLHSQGRTHRDWGAFPETLARSGYRALAVELRATATPAADGDDPVPEDRGAAADLQAALSWLRAEPGADPSRLAVVGASLGADLACVAAGRGLVRSVVAISPDRDRVHILAAGAPLHIQSVFLMAASGDPGAEASARRLSLESRVPKEVRILAGTSDRGEALLAVHPEAVDLVLDWFHRTL